MKANLPIAVVTGFQNIGRELAGIIETKDAADILGEPWLTQLRTVHEQMNTTLATMPPTEQIAAAGEGNWALMSLHHNLLSVQNIVRSITGMMDNNRSRYGTLKASADKLTSIEAEITSGTLIKKDAAEGLISTAKADADKAGFARGLAIGQRKAGLTLCGISAEVAAAAPESVLAMNDADFAKAQDKAKERDGKLIELFGKDIATATRVELVWAEDARYDNQVELFGKLKGTDRAAAPATPPTPLNPMLAGAGTPPAAAGKDQPKALRFAI